MRTKPSKMIQIRWVKCIWCFVVCRNSDGCCKNVNVAICQFDQNPGIKTGKLREKCLFIVVVMNLKLYQDPGSVVNPGMFKIFQSHKCCDDIEECTIFLELCSLHVRGHNNKVTYMFCWLFLMFLLILFDSCWTVKFLSLVQYASMLPTLWGVYHLDVLHFERLVK